MVVSRWDRRLYAADSHDLAALRTYLESMWQDSLAPYVAAAEAKADNGPGD